MKHVLRHVARASAFAALSCLAVSAHALTYGGTLYFTTFAGGTNVWSNTWSYDSTASLFGLGSNSPVAATAGADGLLFAPNGNLVIAGQNTDSLHEITTGGTAVTTVAAGTGSYHMALSGNAPNATLYNLWNGPGSGGSTAISGATLSGGGLAGAGVPYAVNCAPASVGCSTDVRGLAFDPVNKVWYYGTAPDGAAGTFGTVVMNDVTHTATLTQLLSGVFAHGLTYDPFTGDIIMSSASTISQYAPGIGIVGSLTLGTEQYDQSAVDGSGHLFLASNFGNLAFVDYGSTGNIQTNTFSTVRFLAANLDDIAPLSGAGSRTVPEPATLALLALGVGGLAVARRRRQ